MRLPAGAFGRGFLETRPDVDASRIGIIGYSKGGMEAYLAAGADPRLRLAAEYA
jgi:dipeptidyl aminopeptidase/acylaminoacyl peptidase